MEYKDYAWVKGKTAETKSKIIANLTLSDKSLDYPIGRKVWLNQIKECGTDNKLLPLVLTSCDPSVEFTCDIGQCISIDQRCDDNKDCIDGSDEHQCKQFVLEDPYDKAMPPSIRNHISGEKEARVEARIEIISIDKINTLESNTEITYRLIFSWMDHKMTYLNTFDDIRMNSTTKDISSAGSFIWNPFSRLVHVNAAVGSVLQEEDSKKLRVTVKNSIGYPDPENSYEEAVYDGSKGTLAMYMKLKGTYDCSFDLFRFPFDNQVCSYQLKLEDVSSRQILLLPSKDSVTFHGSRVLEEFEVTDWYSCSRDVDDGSEFIFFIKLQHLYFQQLSTFYLQICLMWGVGYLTLYINLDNFNNRFMGSITSLLVLCSLMNSLNQRLPSSGTMKLIDIWNIWFILQIILIIVMHVIINARSNNNLVTAYKDMNSSTSSKLLKSEKLNVMSKIAFPCINLVFIIVYSIVNLAHKEVFNSC